MDIFDGVLFARARSTDGWVIHEISRGKRKGKIVERNEETGSLRDLISGSSAERLDNPETMLAKADRDSPTDLHMVADAFLDRGGPGDEQRSAALRRVATISPPATDWKANVLTENEKEGSFALVSPRLQEAYERMALVFGDQAADEDGVVSAWPIGGLRGFRRHIRERADDVIRHGRHNEDQWLLENSEDDSLAGNMEYMADLADITALLGLPSQSRQLKKAYLKARLQQINMDT